MHPHKSSSATQRTLSPVEPTLRRVKGSRNLSSAISDFDGMASPSVLHEPLPLTNSQPCIPSLLPKPLRIQKTQLRIAPIARPADLQKTTTSEVVPRPLGITKPLRIRKTPSHTTPTAHPSEVQETLPTTVVEALQIHKPLPKTPVSAPEPLQISTSRPPVTSSVGAIEAGKHTLKVGLKPTPRRRAREPAMEKPRRQRPDSSTKSERKESLNSDPPRGTPPSSPPLIRPTSVLWEIRMKPNLDLGGNVIPPPPRSLRSRRKAWKKSCLFIVKRRGSLLRNLSKKLQPAQETPLTSTTAEQASVAPPLGRNLIVEKRDLLREDETALQRENEELKQRVEVLERECDEAKSDALREMKIAVHREHLLKAEREKVKMLQVQLENLAQGHLASGIASAGGTQVEQRISTSGVIQVGTDVAAMRNTQDPGLDDGKEPPSRATPFPSKNYPNASFKQHPERHQAHAFALPGESSIHELPATPAGESPSHSVKEMASASEQTVSIPEIETPFRLPEMSRPSGPR